MQIHDVPPLVTIGTFSAVCAFALWKGGPEERAVAIVHESLMLSGFSRPIGSPDLPVDLLLPATCLVCALRSRSYWTIWAAAAALLSVVTSGVFHFGGGIGLWAYLSAQLVWSYALTAALLCGVLVRRRTTAATARARH